MHSQVPRPWRGEEVLSTPGTQQGLSPYRGTARTSPNAQGQGHQALSCHPPSAKPHRRGTHQLGVPVVLAPSLAVLRSQLLCPLQHTVSRGVGLIPSKDVPVPPEAILGPVMFSNRITTMPGQQPSSVSPELQLDWCVTGISCSGTPHQWDGSTGGSPPPGHSQLSAAGFWAGLPLPWDSCLGHGCSFWGATLPGGQQQSLPCCLLPCPCPCPFCHALTPILGL